MAQVNDTLIEPDVVESVGLSDPVADVRATSSRGTLDETVFETFKRDIFEINGRLKQVVYPHFVLNRQATSEQETGAAVHCDLWAPLAFIILYSVSVSRSHAKSLFSGLFVSMWGALALMALHLRLVKPHEQHSLMSYVSMSGYCLFPQVVNSILGQFVLPLIFKLGRGAPWSIRILMVLRVLLLAISVVWSVNSIRVVAKCQTVVEIYPLALCFFVIGWLSIVFRHI